MHTNVLLSRLVAYGSNSGADSLNIERMKTPVVSKENQPSWSGTGVLLGTPCQGLLRTTATQEKVHESNPKGMTEDTHYPEDLERSRVAAGLGRRSLIKSCCTINLK